MVRWDHYRFTRCIPWGTGWPAGSPGKLGRSFPSFRPQALKCGGESVGPDSGSRSFCLSYRPPHTLSGTQYLPNRPGTCPGLPAVCHPQQGPEELGQDLRICWRPCQKTLRISGGTLPHPDPARQVCQPCDPYRSQLSSPGRCSHRPASLLPRPILFFCPSAEKEPAVQLAGCNLF